MALLQEFLHFLPDARYSRWFNSSAEASNRMKPHHYLAATKPGRLCKRCCKQASAPGLSRGVRATIAAQTVFYMAPDWIWKCSSSLCIDRLTFSGPEAGMLGTRRCCARLFSCRSAACLERRAVQAAALPVKAFEARLATHPMPPPALRRF